MRRFILRLLVFSVYASVVYVAALIIVGVFFPDKFKKNLKYVLGGNGNLYTRIKQADTVKNVDVLVVGSSHAYRGYDPRIFAKNGLRMFNLGSSAQTLVQTEALLNQYLFKIKPKYVIVDIYPDLMEFDGVESSLDIISNGHITAPILKMVMIMNNIDVYNTLIYSWGRQQIGLNRNFVEPLDKNGDSYISGGFVQSYKMSIGKRHNYKESYTYSFNDKQLAAFSRIIKTIEQEKVKYALVQAPLPVERYRRIKNSTNVDSIISSMGPYYNFNNTTPLSDSMFVDDSHLNQLGVNKYNSEVLKKLKLVKKIK